MRVIRAWPRITVVAAMTLLYCSGVCAAALTVQVIDKNGNQVADAVVYAEPGVAPAAGHPIAAAQITQKNRHFNPLVTVVESGASISFPNQDTVRHHVYSFSPAKVFELKLYAGVPANPVIFDKPGTVVLGCNIHDQMIAYVKVVTTPYFAKSDASGSAKIDGLPAGDYRIKLWHFRQVNATTDQEQLITLAGSDQDIKFVVDLKNPPTNE